MHSKTKIFFLIPVIDVEVVETDTSFLTFETLSIWLYNVPFCHNDNIWSHLHLSSFLITSAILTLVAEVVESRLFFRYFLFLSFLTLLKGLESWVKVDTEAFEVLELFLKWIFIALWV